MKKPKISFGFALFDDFILVTKTGQYTGPSSGKLFIMFLIFFTVAFSCAYIASLGIEIVDHLYSVDLSHWRFLIQLILFLGFMKISSVSRYHSLEHKVVNLIESEEDITYENVRDIDGFSSRCGSMLLGDAVFILLLIKIYAYIDISAWIFYSVGIVLFIFLSSILGEIIQRVFTLKKPLNDEIILAVNKGRKLMFDYENGRKNDKPLFFTLAFLAYILVFMMFVTMGMAI